VSLAAREFVRRRRFRPAGRPAHPVRDAIRAESASGVKVPIWPGDTD